MSASLKQFLQSTEPFRVLPSKELDHLADLAKEKTYDKGETIFSEGEGADSVWILKEGRVQIFKYTTQGRPLAIESIAPKEMFGTLCRLGGNQRNYPCTAIAAVSSVTIKILDQTFLEIYNKYPCMVTGVCALCSQRLNAIQSLSCMGQEPVEKRIVNILFQLKKSHGTTLPFTKREIAELSGTTVETTIRTMSEFQKKGWVRSSRGRIVLANLKELEEVLTTTLS